MPITFKKETLANGLTIVAEVNADAHTSAVGFFVKTGARDEDHQVMGVSHFLEHMMFKGTARRTADDVNREFDEIGANYNAYTSHENTVYYAQVLPEYLARAVDLLGDMLRPALRDEDFNVEKNVILEEIGMYDDRPQWRLQDTLIERYFAQHPLGFRVLGTAESIKALAVGQMRAYFDRRYSPDNMTVAASGRIDFARLVADIARLTGDWRPTGATREEHAPAGRSHDESMIDAKLNRHYVAMMCPGPSAQDERRYAASVLADVVGDSDGSHLYWNLIDPGLADEADFSHQPQDHTGAFVAYASCDPDRAAQVERLLLETIDCVVDRVTEDDLERTKNKLATEATLHGESPGGRMRDLGSQWTYLRQYTPLEEEVRRLTAVTLDDLRRLAGDLRAGARTIVRLGPK